MRQLSFVCCINCPDIARSCALASPCLLPEAGHQLILVGGANSAGSGMSTGLTLAKHEWVVMFHQDVFLPDDYLIKQRFPGMTPAQIRRYAERWKPWRSYALLHIWYTEGWQPDEA